MNKVDDIYVWLGRAQMFAAVIRKGKHQRVCRITQASYFRLENIAAELSRINWIYGRDGAMHFALIIHRPAIQNPTP